MEKEWITPNYQWIKKHDEIILGCHKATKRHLMLALLFLAATAGCFFVNKIAMAVPAIIAISYLVKASRGMTKEKCENLYRDGMLTPAIIVKTSPLTIMTITNMTAESGYKTRHGCYITVVKDLPGVTIRLNEKLPCMSLFGGWGDGYFKTFQPHPLCWGTSNQEEIGNALAYLNQEVEPGEMDDWEVLRDIAGQTTEYEHNMILILDENNKLVGKQHLSDDDFEPYLSDAVRSKYTKKEPEPQYISANISAADFYNQMIDLALEHQVYEYFSVHCEGGDMLYTEMKGYFTYLGDPKLFMEAVKKRDLPLAKDEYPLFGGSYMVTTKGCWKKTLLPWSEVTIAAKIFAGDQIRISINDKHTASVKLNVEYYIGKEQFTKTDLEYILRIEEERLHYFLQNLKELCINKGS